MKTYNSWDKKQNERDIYDTILYLVSNYNIKNNNDSKG
jgi:hypothetical protein